MNREELRQLIKGTPVTIPTPFDDKMQIDLARMTDLTRWWMESGLGTDVAPLKATAAMGEGPDLSDDEWPHVLRTVVNAAGSDAVVMAYFGDGATSEGDPHEGMNFAAVHRLPIIFLCENNGYAISVPLSKQMAVDSVASRAEGYGMPGVVVDGTDIVAVYQATAEAAARAGDNAERSSS